MVYIEGKWVDKRKPESETSSVPLKDSKDVIIEQLTKAITELTKERDELLDLFAEAAGASYENTGKAGLRPGSLRWAASRAGISKQAMQQRVTKHHFTKSWKDLSPTQKRDLMYKKA